MNKTLKLSMVTASTLFLLTGCQNLNQQHNQPSPWTNNNTISTNDNNDKTIKFEKPLDSKLTLISFNANKPLLFRPFDKSNKSKKVYFSFVGQITDFIDIKSNIEKNLQEMGYKISTDPNKSDIYVAIYMLNNSVKVFKKGVNYLEHKEFDFSVILEQRIKGKTMLAETYDLDGSNSGTSKSMQASANYLSANNSENVYASRTSMSDNGMALKSFFTGDKATISGKGENEVQRQRTEILANNHRSIKSKTELNYYLFKDEISVKSKFEILNMQGQENKINKEIGNKLALRLAKLIDF